LLLPVLPHSEYEQLYIDYVEKHDEAANRVATLEVPRPAPAPRPHPADAAPLQSELEESKEKHALLARQLRDEATTVERGTHARSAVRRSARNRGPCSKM
jgi:hypothetical protein